MTDSTVQDSALAGTIPTPAKPASTSLTYEGGPAYPSNGQPWHVTGRRVRFIEAAPESSTSRFHHVVDHHGRPILMIERSVRLSIHEISAIVQTLRSKHNTLRRNGLRRPMVCVLGDRRLWVRCKLSTGGRTKVTVKNADAAYGRAVAFALGQMLIELTGRDHGYSKGADDLGFEIVSRPSNGASEITAVQEDRS